MRRFTIVLAVCMMAVLAAGFASAEIHGNCCFTVTIIPIFHEDQSHWFGPPGEEQKCNYVMITNMGSQADKTCQYINMTYQMDCTLCGHLHIEQHPCSTLQLWCYSEQGHDCHPDNNVHTGWVDSCHQNCHVPGCFCVGPVLMHTGDPPTP